MDFQEIFYVGSTILVGGTLGHLALLSLSKGLSSKSLTATSFHGMRTSCISDDDLSTERLINIKHTDLPPQSGRLLADSRGFIASLPQRPVVVEKSWEREDRRHAINKAVMASQHQNSRSTYLGAETFESSNPAAQLFGWHRVEGRPTIQLGEIAQLADNAGDSALRVLLHPEDAQTMLNAGWAREVTSGRWQKSIPGQRVTDGVEVLVVAPRNKTEVETVINKVLDAAVWFVAGLDEQEDV